MRPVTVTVEAAVENQGDDLRRLDGRWTGEGPGLEHWRITGSVWFREDEDGADLPKFTKVELCDDVAWREMDELDLRGRDRAELLEWLLEAAEPLRPAQRESAQEAA